MALPDVVIIAQANDHHLAAYYGGTNTWVNEDQLPGMTNRQIQAVCYSPERELWVAVTEEGDVWTTSNDDPLIGPWAQQGTWGTSQDLRQVVFVPEWGTNGRWVLLGRHDAPGTDDTTVVWSDDGITWTDITGTVDSISDNKIDGVHLLYAPALGKLFAFLAQGRVWSSLDGKVWSRETTLSSGLTGNSETTRGVAWSEELGLLAVITENHGVWTSPDGLIWTERTYTATAGDTLAIGWNPDRGEFFITHTGSNGAWIISDDGITWTVTYPGFEDHLRYRNWSVLAVWSRPLNKYVVQGVQGFTLGSDWWFSEDGVTWIEASPSNLGSLYYSSLYATPVPPNEPPNVPTNLQVTSVGTDTTPVFSADISDPDTDQQIKARFEVRTLAGVVLGTLDSAFRTGAGTITAEWADALALGEYQVRVKTIDDAGEESAYTAWVDFTITQFVSPVSLNLIWNVIGSVPKELSLLWDIAEGNQKDLGLVWNTAKFVSEDLELLWNKKTPWTEVTESTDIWRRVYQ